MPKVPSSVLRLLTDLPENQIASVCKSLRITETAEYKKYVASQYRSSSPCKDFLVAQLGGGNKSTLQAIYSSIEGFLFVGGCAPGIGIAFNLIDACFCFALGNFFGCFVAIVSCFPIPGFKVAGKGLEKILVGLLKHITPTKLMGFIKALQKRLMNYFGEGFLFNSGLHQKSLALIRKQLENLIPCIDNPFAAEIIKTLSELLKHFPSSTKAVSDKVCKSGKDLISDYSVHPKEISPYYVFIKK